MGLTMFLAFFLFGVIVLGCRLNIHDVSMSLPHPLLSRGCLQGETTALRALRRGLPINPLYEGSGISTTVKDALTVIVLGDSPTVRSNSVVPVGYTECPVKPVRGVDTGFKCLRGRPIGRNLIGIRYQQNSLYQPAFELLTKGSAWGSSYPTSSLSKKVIGS
ncbi:hypothetical protein LIER_01934 [Lithospermum erythrorhizon]|uniref:Uncharacterized protein n=1 Tax=Lithospermum erythrorhizon TaxID=34254 RepID=A0AAV3NMS3_LITER